MNYKIVESQMACQTNVVKITDEGKESTIIGIGAYRTSENPVAITEFTYCWKADIDSTNSLGIPRERAVNDIGEEGIAAGEHNIEDQVKQINDFIAAARKNPLYDQMKTVVDQHVEHYHCDFTVYDCEELGRGADHFIWITRPCGTHMIRCQCPGYDYTIRIAINNSRHQAFLAEDGVLKPVAKAELLELYQSFKLFKEEEEAVPA